MLDDINSSTRGLVRDINKQAETMSKQARPIVEEARRLLLLINTFKNWPNPLEALDRRISFTVQQMQQVIDPVLLARNSVNSLLERVNHLAESLPETKDLPSNAEIRDYSRQVTKAQKSLTDVIKRYDSVLSPTQDMMADLKKAQKDIATMLPQLWRDYYLQGPVPISASRPGRPCPNACNMSGRASSCACPWRSPSAPTTGIRPACASPFAFCWCCSPAWCSTVAGAIPGPTARWAATCSM